MQPPTAVVTDSTSDLPAQEVERLAVTVVPAIVTLDGQSYVDGAGLSRTEFYRRLPSLRQPATTAAPPPGVFAEAYERLLSAGAQAVLSLHLSQKLSGMLDIARQAATAFGERVRTFDSQQVSLGLGFQAAAAASAAWRGEPLQAVLETARSARARARTIAMINTLEYLRRSGRVSWLRAGLGEALRVKLLVAVIDGAVQRLDEVRTRGRALGALEAQARAWGPLERLAVLHSAIPEQAAAFAARLRQLCAETPLVVDVTTVIGAHVGPGSIGLAALTR